MAEALRTVRKVAKPLGEAAAIFVCTLADGSLLGRAEYLRMGDGEGAIEYRKHIVPPSVWTSDLIPPPGHSFWLSGDVRILSKPYPDGARLQIEGIPISIPFGAVTPIITIRGLRVSRDGLVALCRSLSGATGRGRPKGAGSFAEDDDVLMSKMHRLVTDGGALSASEAAKEVVSKAAGAGTPESKIKRLTKRYYQRFPKR